MKIRTAIASRVTLRRAAAILVAVPSLLLFSPAAAHAATAGPGILRCEGASTVITHQPTVSVGAGETGGYFAWLPALVDLNGQTPRLAQYGEWQYGYAQSGAATPYWQQFGSGVIRQFEVFTAPTTGRWAIYNFGYDYRTQRSFTFGYSSATACTFAPNLFTPNP